MSTGTSDDRLTTRQAATLLGVGIHMVYTWMRACQIRSERITPPESRVYLLLNRDDVEQVRRDRGPRDRA